MNATQIIDDTMTLEEKLAAIDQAMLNAQAQANDEADLSMCEGCQ